MIIIGTIHFTAFCDLCVCSGFAWDEDAGASCLDFLGLLLLLLFAACVVVLIVMMYKGWKLRRLTHPEKEYIYKKQKH